MQKISYSIDLKDYIRLSVNTKFRFYELYKIKEIESQNVYAANIFLLELVELNKSNSSFLNMINIISKLSHHSIISFRGFSKTDFNQEQYPVIITEYTSNITLSNIIQKEKREIISKYWNDTKKLINIYGIASSMQYLHRRKIIYQNLNPENVFETSNFYPKLFLYNFFNSISQKVEKQFDSNYTKFYIAPEILEKNNFSSSCDVYSFALIVYSIMTDEKPFENENQQIFDDSFTLKIINGHRPKFNNQIPEVYCHLIESCWDKNPSKRPTFESIVNELKNNSNFITEKVNKEEYERYIESIEENQEIKANHQFESNERIEVNQQFEDNQKIEVNQQFEDNQRIEVNQQFEDNQRIEVNQQFEDNQKIEVNQQFEDNQRIEVNQPFVENREKKHSLFESNINHVNLNNFEIIELIGTGSFSEVYKVKDKHSGLIYAAKVIRIKHNEKVKQETDFQNEVKILSKLENHSIMKFIGFSPTDFNMNPNPVIITEYMTNGSLEDLLEIERNDFSIQFWDDTMKLINIYGIASSISYLHSHNIIHCDLKPKNILLDDFLFPKLSDFGFSRFISSQKIEKNSKIQTGTIGTASFIAPEILKENKYTKSSDVYAFGMIVYEIVNKKYPFEGLRDILIEYKVSVEEKRPEMNNGIPEVFKDLIESCWNQDPNKRPSIEKIVNDLKNKNEYITEKVDVGTYRSFIECIEKNEMKNEKFTKHSMHEIYKKYEDLMKSQMDCF